MNIKKIKINPKAIIGIILLAFTFCGNNYTFFGKTQTTAWYVMYYGKFLVCIGFVFAALLRWYRLKQLPTDIKVYTKLHLTPRILIFVYTIILLLATHGSFRYYTRCISTTLYLLLSLFSAMAFVFLYEEKALLYGFGAAVLHYTANIFISVYKTSPFELFQQLLYIGRTTSPIKIEEFLETNEVIYVLGLYLLCFIFLSRETIKAHKILFIYGIICFILGNKRIGFAAFIITFVFGLILDRISLKSQKRLIQIAGYSGIVLSMFYIFLTESGKLNEILQNMHVNTMGRSILYSYFSQFCDFKISYFGRGYGVVSKMLESTTREQLSYMAKVHALHNELFKLFIELGFMGTLLWLWYYLVGLPKAFSKHFSFDITKCYVIITVFIFVTYLTDNTEGFFCVQQHLMMIPLAFYYLGRKAVKEDVAEHNVDVENLEV